MNDSYREPKIKITPPIAIACIIVINLLVSVLVRNYLIYTPNTYPFGINFGNDISISLVVAFVTFGVWALKLFTRFPVPTVLVLSGVWSNYIERYLFGGQVADYISFVFNIANLADVQIWAGLIWLNCLIWFPSIKRSWDALDQTDDTIHHVKNS